VSKNISYPLNYFPKLCTFGYSLGFQLCEIFNGQESDCHRAGILSALFNMYACLFDFICDKNQKSIPALLSIINRSSLENAVFQKDKSVIDFFKKGNSQDFLIRFISCLMNEYFHRIRNEQLWQTSDQYTNDLGKSILMSYDSELKSVNFGLKFDPVNYNIYGTLFNKSALPAWIICLNSILCLDKKLDNLSTIKKVILGIGKSIWIADDLTDISEDLDSNYWNYLTLKLHNESGIKILQNDNMIRKKTDIYSDLLSTGTIKNTTKEMCESFIESFTILDNITPNSSKLKMNLLVWINGWFNDLN